MVILVKVLAVASDFRRLKLLPADDLRETGADPHAPDGIRHCKQWQQCDPLSWQHPMLELLQEDCLCSTVLPSGVLKSVSPCVVDAEVWALMAILGAVMTDCLRRLKLPPDDLLETGADAQ